MIREAGVDLRLLTEAVPDLMEIVSRPPKSGSHPLGPWIRRNKRYDLGAAHVPLPRHEPGVANLRAASLAPIPRVPPELTADAWQVFLDRAPLVRQITNITDIDLLKAGISVPPDQRHRLRRFVLAGVLQLGERTPSSDVPAQRIGCVATVTVRLHATVDNSAEDAWIEAGWFTTTRGLAGRLGDTYSSNGLQPDRSSPRLGVLADASWMAARSQQDHSEVRGLAAAFGFASSLLIVTPGSFNQVSDTVRRRSPAVLVVLNAGRSAGLGPLVSYWETATGRRARHVHADGFSEMLEGLREELADLVGVTDTLYRLPARVESGPVPDRVPAFPVARTDKCYVDGTGRHYARDPETELWWTKDTKGDGGTVFKTYRRDNGQLLFEADRSADGGVIPKHKGPTGEKIDLNDLGGCAHPERHANKALL